MTWGQALLDLLFPVRCPGCGRMTCADAPWCRTCLAAFWHPRLIADSRRGALDGCYTCCQYDGALRECILQLKYGGRRSRGRVFPQLLEAFPWWDRLSSYDLAVPVPLSAARRAERGYNQCDEIFSDFLTRAGKEYIPDFLVRIRDTKVQSKLSREARRDNVRGAFHVNRGRSAAGRRVLLVDDVYTTGATLGEAARELRRAGAASVMGFTAASGAP